MKQEQGPRVSAVRFPEAYDLPAAPEDASRDMQDAFRQTAFLLKSDLRLFEEGMRMQVHFANEASHSSLRTHPYAALVALWSRGFLSLADACLLVTRGSYGPALPLVRSACEFIAAQRQLHRGEIQEYLDWLIGSLSPDETHKAIDIGLGRYFAGGMLAEDEALGATYRAVSDLSRPNFGATLLLVGPESNHQRLALAFADSAFHFGWAQLTLGWLLHLCERQLAFIDSASDVFGGGDNRRAEVSTYAANVQQSLASPDRCRVEEVEDGGMRRYLVHNFRRAPGGAAKKLLL